MNRVCIPVFLFLCLSCILLLTTLLFADSPADDTYGATYVDTKHIDLTITVDYDNERLHGICQMTFLNPTDKPAIRIPLLLYRLLSVKTITDAAGHPIPFTQQIMRYDDFDIQQENFILIDLPQPLVPQDSITISVEYEGALLGRSEVYGYVYDHIDPAFTIIRNDCSAFPWVGFPSWAKNRALIFQRYTYRASINVPDSLVVANGGDLVAKSALDNGRIEYIYKSRRPSWRMDFAVAPYQRITRGQDAVFCFPEDTLNANKILDAMANAKKLYTDWFGPLPHDDGLTVIEIPDDNGSQTDVTTIIQTAAAFKDEHSMYEFYHELSHKWNVSIIDIPHCRWEEGLACFLQDLVTEKLEHRPALDSTISRTMARLKSSFESKPANRVPMIDYGKQQITGYSYLVGRVFFYLLYETVGHDDFVKAYGSFFQQYAESETTTEEFYRYFNAQTKTDVGRLFEEWMYGTEYIDLIVNETPTADILARYKR
ncbi:MAG: M1 family aminopeptidase [Candidatus Zixiibacteriota bacterium]